MLFPQEHNVRADFFLSGRRRQEAARHRRSVSSVLDLTLRDPSQADEWLVFSNPHTTNSVRLARKESKRVGVMRRLSVRYSAEKGREISTAHSHLGMHTTDIDPDDMSESKSSSPTDFKARETRSANGRHKVSFSVKSIDAVPEPVLPRRPKSQYRRASEPNRKPPGHLSRDLFRSIMARDSLGTSNLICQGADLNFADENGYTALHIACGVVYPPKDSMDEVLDEESGTPAETKAVYEPSLEICDILLDFGANINRNDNSGRSPLYYACTGLHLDLVRSLTKRGAKVRRIDFDVVQTAKGFATYSPDVKARNRELIRRCLERNVLEDTKVAKRKSIAPPQSLDGSPKRLTQGVRWSNINGGWVAEDEGDGVRSRIYISPSAHQLLTGEAR